MAKYPCAILTVCVFIIKTHVYSELVVRQTVYGKIRGYVHTVLQNEKVERYFGIPYAAAPVGNLRFENPQEPAHWSDILSTVELPPACPQETWEYIHMHVPDFNYTNEDCLYLNIYVPVTGEKNIKQMAVLVHIHGGTNLAGMGAMFHGDILAVLANIIVVTFNYRLGILGFISGDSVHFPGNYGLLDQNLALQWVKKNIHFFGGDPEKVTVEGHSAGAGDVGLHILSPKSKGLFRYAIVQSGSPTAHWAFVNSPRNSKSELERMAKFLDCHTEDIKQCLRAADVQAMNGICFQGGLCQPVKDDVFLYDSPVNLLEDEPLNGRVYMMGTTRDELLFERPSYRQLSAEHIMRYFCPVFGVISDSAVANMILHEYMPWSDPNNTTAKMIAISNIMSDKIIVAPLIDFATRLEKRNKELYFYNFEYHSHLSPPPFWKGVPHGRDLFYLFGCPFTGHPLYNYSDEDRQVSNMLIEIWGNFIKHGKPSSSSFSADRFPPFTSSDQKYMKISGYEGNGTIAVGSRLKARQVHLWNVLIPSYKPKRISQNSGIPLITWVFISVALFLLTVTVVLIAYVVSLKRRRESRETV